MADVLELVKKHKVATAGIAAVIVLYLVLRSSASGGAASSGGTNALQIAQLQASQNLQQAQIQAQQNVAELSAQVQQNQNNEGLEAYQDELAAGLTAQESGQQSQTEVYNALLSSAESEQESNNQLEEQQLTAQQGLAEQAIALTNKGGRTQAGVNELAEILGQEGQTSSYNQSTAAQGIAETMANEQLLSGLLGTGNSVLSSIGL